MACLSGFPGRQLAVYVDIPDQLNTCISYLRKSKSQVEAITLPVNLEISDENDGGRSSQLHELYRLIHALNPLERAMILLWLEERSYEEIAQIIGISKNNVAYASTASKIN